MPTENKGEIVIFKTSDEKVSIDVRFEGETVQFTIDMIWLPCLKNLAQQ